MSLIPLDEQRGDGPSEPRQGPEDTSIVQRFLAEAKSVLLALPGVSALASESAETRSEAPANTTKRKAPATPPSGSVGERVEVVSTATGDRLTIEAVDNSDATISSDTWESVER